ncbi:MAG: hypothetical protein R3E90_10470 [Marinicella sp.]
MNSKALPFLIIAGLVLAGAAIWKVTSENDAENITAIEQPTKNFTTDVKQVAKPVVEEDITIEEYDKPVVDTLSMTPEERKEKASNLMSFAMQYSTAEKAIAGLKRFRESGNEKMANDILDYIRITFPNQTIPKELLD